MPPISNYRYDHASYSRKSWAAAFGAMLIRDNLSVEAFAVTQLYPPAPLGQPCLAKRLALATHVERFLLQPLLSSSGALPRQTEEKRLS
jgi:hypothetical protein